MADSRFDGLTTTEQEVVKLLRHQSTGTVYDACYAVGYHGKMNELALDLLRRGLIKYIEQDERLPASMRCVAYVRHRPAHRGISIRRLLRLGR